jgi:hypothetical protein
MMLHQVTQQKYWKMPSNRPESHFAKRVNNCEGCWYHSQQDHDGSLRLSNQMNWKDITALPLILFPAMILKDARQ